MTDFHTHILPGIDDGARDTEASLSMLTSLAAQGIENVVLTPHFYCGEMTLSKFLERRANAYAKLSERTGGIDLRLILGAEVLISSFKIGDLEDFTPLKIGDTDYIMLELPFYKTWSEQLLKNVKDIAQSTNLFPIIAHVERYPAVARDPSLADELIDMGCLLQINARSLYDGQLKKLSEKLVERHKIHCFGTDCHNMSTRSPAYTESFGRLAELGGKEYARRIQENMRVILDGGRIAAERTPAIRKRLWSYR